MPIRSGVVCHHVQGGFAPIWSPQCMWLQCHGKDATQKTHSVCFNNGLYIVEIGGYKWSKSKPHFSAAFSSPSAHALGMYASSPQPCEFHSHANTLPLPQPAEMDIDTRQSRTSIAYPGYSHIQYLSVTSLLHKAKRFAYHPLIL